MRDALGYAGQRVVVTGAASGMGEAAAKLLVGADIVFVPDVAVEGVVLVPDPDPSDNCFARNLFGTEFPDGVTSAFACP